MSVCSVNPRRARRFSGALLFLLICAGACSRQVGDSCASNVECSPLGDRFCDLSSPAGYCTVEGCDVTTCPDNSACVSFFSLQRGVTRCAVGKTPRAGCNDGSCCTPGTAGCCRLGERCLCDEPNCQMGYCASETSERRWCMHMCNSDSDCRENYQCFTTNGSGAIGVTYRTDMGEITTPVVNYCAPKRTQ